ncbi:MAG: hypothetical protein RMX96_13475 [Nostoc sp. ChiSLP02]|nr:hypothetical protein [Nostoc sp. DedSLP05]MDZ8098974.1 hypothetical protein [Nostoc sp. DedSLP01]MDZ8185850.1 hypothetical protein [Nostoc sp. ChiSLP02]
MLQNVSSQFAGWIFSLIAFGLMLIIFFLPFVRPDIEIFEQTSTRLIFQIRIVFFRTLSLFFAVFPLTIAILLIISVFFIPDLTTEMLFEAYGIAILFFIITLLILAVVPFSNYTFDKESNSIKINNYKWFSTQVIEYPLSQIVGLQIEEGDGEDGKVYRFNLKSVSGKNLPLNECYRSFSYEERQLLTKSIETFLNSN